MEGERVGIPRWDDVRWTSADTFSLDEVNFYLTTTDFERPSTEAEFVFLKDAAFITSYRELLTGRNVHRMLEIGFFHGAGLAFYGMLLNPDKIVGIDVMQDAPVLEHHMARGTVRSVIPYFDVDQADKESVGTILQKEFANRDIDLVIDDASHMYYPARASFERVFPYVAEGGLYVIEDWGWAHWRGPWWQEPEVPLIEGPGLSNLVFELVMTQASSPGVISAIHIDYYRVAVVRGADELPAEGCVLNDLYVARGRPPSLV
jgi:hypothetical protein